MAFAGILFDVDGVLVDSPHERAWRETLDELMQGPWKALAAQSLYTPARFDTAVYQKLVAGKPREDGARAALEYFGVPDAAVHATEYAAAKQAKILGLIQEGAFQAFPDALRFVLAVRDMGLPMAVASSSKNANELLARIVVPEPMPGLRPDPLGKEPGTTLVDLFDANVCGRTFPRGKPSPDIFLGAAAELGVQPEAALVVEDATSGVQAAKAGGMQALGVARLGDAELLRAAGADLVVESLDEVDRDALARGTLARIRKAA
ncbi:HAD family hydrolase [Polyangium sorediatum]|uniref:HAD-IA family hydrolase n=1 Tax=Polyangium sorediatum TaxID=889274 RepID=A0ABT6P6N6_9BACT|nr:HAD-IA family hydrolase [Polyangium sorediatum]MDI1435845.1 HAD-IA family hydrolase [Polyangium sorediatum]